MTNSKLLEKVDGFLRSITKKDKVCIIHDTDPDGVCSAIIMAKCVERLRGKKIEMHIPVDKKQYGITTGMMKVLKKKKITKLITVDFSAEHDIPKLKKLEKQMQILIIDHHKIYNKIRSKKTVLYKPQLFSKIEPSRYCTAKLAYDAAKRVENVEDLDWVAATACIADIATKPWKKWLNQVFKKWKVKMKKDLFKTEIGQVAVTISSTEVYDARLVPKCFEVFYKAKKPKDVLKSKLGKYRKIIDKELFRHIKLFNKKSKKYGNVHVYEMAAKYRIHSPMSTILGLKYPHKTIIIINKIGNLIAVSARRGDRKIAVNLLLEKAVKGIPGANAGGHTPAAGAGFHSKHLKKFKQRLHNG